MADYDEVPYYPALPSVYSPYRRQSRSPASKYRTADRHGPNYQFRLTMNSADLLPPLKRFT